MADKPSTTDTIDFTEINFDIPSDMDTTQGPDITGEPKPDEPVVISDDTPKDDDADKPEDQDLEDDADKSKENDDDADEKDDDDDGETPFVDELAASFGYDFGDETFTDDEDGIRKLTVRAAEMKFDQLFENLATEAPDAHDLLQYILDGGDVRNYVNVMSPETDYSKIEIGDDSALQERVVRDYLREQGDSEDDIKTAIEEYKTSGVLKSEATRSLNRLKAGQEALQSSLVETQRQEREAAEQKQQRYFEKIETIVKESSEIKGLPIPEKEKDSFLRFIRPANGAPSEYAKKVHAGLDDKTVLAIQYLVMKGGDISDLIDTKAKTKVAQSVRDKLKGTRPQSSGSAARQRDKTNTAAPNVADLDLSIPTE